MASNLPPGVSESMIPGNRPEDVAEEAFFDALIEKLESLADAKHKVPDELWAKEWFQNALRAARDLGYIEGTNDARMEADLASAHAHEKLMDATRRVTAEAEERKFTGKEVKDAQERALKQDMMEAHSEGLHDEIPREGCPYCQQNRYGREHG